MVTLFPSYYLPIYCFPSLGPNAVSLGNNKIALYIFRRFHLFLCTILKKKNCLCFWKGLWIEGSSNGVKVRNGTRRMRIFFLSFFSCFTHLVPEMQEFLLSVLVKRSHRKNTMVLLVFCPTKSFSWKLPISAAFPHGGRILQHTTMQCGIKNLHKTPSLQQTWDNTLPPLGNGTSTITASGELQPHSVNALKFAGLNQDREQVPTSSELRFSCRRRNAKLSQMKQTP